MLYLLLLREGLWKLPRGGRELDCSLIVDDVMEVYDLIKNTFTNAHLYQLADVFKDNGVSKHYLMLAYQLRGWDTQQPVEMFSECDEFEQWFCNVVGKI